MYLFNVFLSYFLQGNKLFNTVATIHSINILKELIFYNKQVNVSWLVVKLVNLLSNYFLSILKTKLVFTYSEKYIDIHVCRMLTST